MPEKEKCMVILQPSGRRGYINQGTTLKEASIALGVDIEGICGEKAICGKCKVRVEEGVFEKYGIESHRDNLSPMSLTEKKFFNQQQQQHGYRLSCQAKVIGNVVVFVPEESRMGKQLVRKAARDIKFEIKPAVRRYLVELPKAHLHSALADWERLQKALNEKYQLKNLTIDYQVLLVLQNMVRQGDWKVTVSIWHGKEVIKVDPGFIEKGYGLAVDVGTTTVAGYLCELASGKLIATASMMNPQVIYGEDVMSRIAYTMSHPGGLEQENQAIIDGLNGIVEDITSQAGIKRQDILDMTVVGNTCMHHLFLNIDPQYIGKAPFPPALHHSLDVKARDWGLKIMPESEKKEGGSSPPCQVACPANVNGQDFLYLIAQGKFDEALEKVREAIPFAGVLGYVCTHPCETECERGKVEESIALRSSHGFLADTELKKGRKRATPIEQTKKDKVAIVGAGPAGLACAYELVRRGYPVSVFEAAPKAGGMLRYGIPEYRLSRELLDNEISYIEELGVEIKTDSPVKDIKKILTQGYKAVFLATGAWISEKMDIPNLDASGVSHALDFLKKVNSGEKVKLGQRVAVVGGGNAAIDAARVAKRLGAKEVLVIYRRSRDEMPAIKAEVDEAEQEGVKFHFLANPVGAVLTNDRLTGLKCIRMELGEPDESGRKRPIPIKGSEFNIDINNVILAIGQSVDKTALAGELEYTKGGTLAADPVTLETNVKGVFAGGDAVLGPSDVISAVYAGQQAAISIELYLEGVDLKEGRPAPLRRVEDVPKVGVEKEARAVMPMLKVEERGGFAQVELGFPNEVVIQESKRCLNCSIFAQVDESETAEQRGIGIKIAPGAYIHVLPIEAGFVGADNVAVLIAEAPYNQDSMELIIDIGTNGELIMGNRKRLLSASCATGPAFEGAEIRHGMRASPGAIEKIVIDRDTREARYKLIGQEKWNTELNEKEIGAKGICGSAIIDIVPQLFLAGIIDRTGRFNKDIDSPRYRVIGNEAEFVIAWAKETSIGQDIVICQQDVRSIQLAKSAMYAGAKIMMRTLGIDKLDKIILAGAFGSFLDKESAALLGLFPDCDLANIYSVGNAAGDGARMALLNVDKREEADVQSQKVQHVELALEPDFNTVYSQAMWLPHMKDKFPHLEHILSLKK